VMSTHDAVASSKRWTVVIPDGTPGVGKSQSVALLVV